MRNNALSVANYFVDKGQNEGVPVRPLKLMKLVYIAYGFALVLIERSIIDKRFDKVEAWKYGPVIPSVYHSFKMYGSNPVKDKTVILEENGNNGIQMITPELEEDIVKEICDFVWKRYGGLSDNELVSLLHRKGTPWELVYVEGENAEIPDYYTSAYYRKIVEALRAEVKRKKYGERKEAFC